MTATDKAATNNATKATAVSVIRDHVDDELRQYQDQSVTLDARTAELTANHPDQFVALEPDGTVIAADTMSNMVNELTNRGIDSRTAAVKFMSAKPYRMIL